MSEQILPLTAQILPSAEANEAITVFSEVLAARTSQDLNDAYFDRDWSGLWRELVDGGWTSFADGPVAGEDGTFSLLDLTAFAEAWGSYLVPLPLVPTLIVRRWIDDRPDASVRLSYVAEEKSGCIIPLGEQAEQVVSGDSLKDRTGLAAARRIDGFAASMPISLLAEGTAPADAGLRREAGILACAEAVGAGAMILRRSVDYVKVREQFGRPVGTFQAVKHQLANLHIRLELSRSALAWCCHNSSATVPATKAVMEHCLRVVEGCVQAHGGIGFTMAASVHRYYRHVMALRRMVAAAAWSGS